MFLCRIVYILFKVLLIDRYFLIGYGIIGCIERMIYKGIYKK